MSLLHAAGVQRWLSGHLLCSVSGAGPRFALTFDDGPSPRNTPRLLDVLARHRAGATFFLLASHARRHPDLVSRTISEGHEIGVHGGLHAPGWSLPRPWFDRETGRAIEVVTEAAGIPPRHYRAPFGLLFPAQVRWARALGLTAVLGNIYPEDVTARSAKAIAGRVVPRLRPGSIVILHDSGAVWDTDRSPTIAAVDVILAAAAEKGLKAVTVQELRDLHS